MSVHDKAVARLRAAIDECHEGWQRSFGRKAEMSELRAAVNTVAGAAGHRLLAPEVALPDRESACALRERAVGGLRLARSPGPDDAVLLWHRDGHCDVLIDSRSKPPPTGQGDLYVEITVDDELRLDVENRARIAHESLDAILRQRVLPELLSRRTDVVQSIATVRFGNTYRRPECWPIDDIEPLVHGVPADSDSRALTPGERCRHPVYGVGAVVGIAGQGERAKVTVDFDKVGQKVILARFLTVA